MYSSNVQSLVFLQFPSTVKGQQIALFQFWLCQTTHWRGYVVVNWDCSFCIELHTNLFAEQGKNSSVRNKFKKLPVEGLFGSGTFIPGVPVKGGIFGSLSTEIHCASRAAC